MKVTRKAMINVTRKTSEGGDKEGEEAGNKEDERGRRVSKAMRKATRMMSEEDEQ